ncbi:MAG TPA: tyrosinase family protein [Pyrinomonadaceae bacterium]|nr:tyrosinase family protein [Pyrinomonadaceae bacterium]
MLSLILALVVAFLPVLTVGQMRVLKVNDLKPGKTVQATPDLYIQDTPADTGIEPNPDTGPMWVTEDIWVRNNPDPGYQPYPFPALTPPWTPLPHENPEYRDPKFSTPNYVYIRVRNRGTAASTGTERLRLYWAKASTGLGWPGQWDDYMASNCGPSKLYGAEVTKPRKNAATATTDERNAYRDAILSVGTLPAFVFPGGITYWHKQDQVHQFGPSNRHGTSAFLPWHREFINRYEVLLQEANPLVTLLYWDWTTNPLSLFTSTFMGASGSGPGSAPIGPPFHPPLGPTLFPPAVSRDLGGNACCTTPTTTTDTSIMAIPSYGPSGLNLNIEGNPNHPHNYSHVYIGGIGGNMSSVPTAAEDPFFFLLHGNVDRLWAQWQRNPAFLSRLDPATAYDADSANVNITTNMRPWDGTGTSIQPWTIADGYIVAKNAKHTSVVSPPIYDTAPLVIPILQPGEAVVIQVPWYPPNPADFACFGDPGHFCLLGRITTSDSTPFGMTFTEIMNVNTNTRNNNNIAWKNVTVVDNFPGAAMAASILIRNIFNETVLTQIRLAKPFQEPTFLDYGNIYVDLKPELFERWKEGDTAGEGFEVVGPTTIKVTKLETVLANIRLEPQEAFPVEVRFELNKDQRAPQKVVPAWDLIQVGTPDNPNAVVGGQRFELDFQKIVLVKTGSQWRYLDNANGPGTNWTSPDFDDSKWKQGRAELGFGDEPVTTISGADKDAARIATYFRHSFDVVDPSFYGNLVLRLKRDDGAVVYLNGKEVTRSNLGGGAVTSSTTATRDVDGLEEEVFFPIAVSPGLLREGRNTIAVAIHQNALDSPDLTFDLELYANAAEQGFAPNVGFVPSIEGSLWQTRQVIPIQAEALDTDGQIKSVSFYADGKLLATDDTAPYSFQWQGASVGAHRLRAIAVDNEQRQSLTDTTVVVVENVPPVVLLTQPRDEAMFAVGADITITANASDVTDGIKQVEFFVREADFFMSPTKSIGVGTRSGSTHTISLKLSTPGHYMVWAVATDDRGASSQSNPIHVGIGTH